MRGDSPMEKLTRADLYPLEQYAAMRGEFRTRVMAHKKHRKVHVGPNATLYFEDRLTMHYQIQEMLRAERIFEAEGIEDELAAYNPLIPDGMNWKATFMVEFDDVDARREALGRFVGIEDRVWMRVNGMDPVYAIADEDLERDTEEKTSAVHFLRFELTAPMVAALQAGAHRVHGTALGIGERAGNCPMDTLLVNMKLMGYIDNDLTGMMDYVRAVSTYTEVPIPSNYPVVGSDAFETGTGVHAAAVIKAFKKGDVELADAVYSGVPAGMVGLEQRIAVGPMAGRSNATFVLERLGIEPTDERVQRVLDAGKSSKRLLTDDEVRAAAGA
ncbi:MAG: DUF3501 family protein [Planctomycetes bacterium]|nr:DUF3501 family protein [Planctomycetota bacterium]